MNSHNRLNPFQLYLLLTAIAMSAFLTSLDGFIVNVAIPSISGDLGVREDVGTWMITLFSTVSTLCVLISGYLSHRISDYRLFMGALITFMIASLGVGLSEQFDESVDLRRAGINSHERSPYRS